MFKFPITEEDSDEAGATKPPLLGRDDGDVVAAPLPKIDEDFAFVIAAANSLRLVTEEDGDESGARFTRVSLPGRAFGDVIAASLPEMRLVFRNAVSFSRSPISEKDDEMTGSKAAAPPPPGCWAVDKVAASLPLLGFGLSFFLAVAFSVCP